MQTLRIAIVPKRGGTWALEKNRAQSRDPRLRGYAIPSGARTLAHPPVPLVPAAGAAPASFGTTNWLGDLELYRRTRPLESSIVAQGRPLRRQEELIGTGDLIKEVAQ